MTPMNGRTVPIAAIALAGALVLAACSRSEGADKAGGAGAPATLRLATMEGQGAPYAAGVEEFARQVEDVSDGALRVEIVWDAAVEYFGGYGLGADQKVAGLVQSGELDMALIPARAWDELGVTGLQALQAPFLVSDEELVGRIVQGEMADEMLSGLADVGVVGLALLPDSLRHPVGFQKPFLTLEDFAGATIRTPPSGASFQILEALGAEPVDVGPDFPDRVASGEIVGAESAFAWAGGTLPVPGVITANITFFPKVNTLVANSEAYAALSDQHRSALEEAAASALASTLETGPSEADWAEQYCEIGGDIAFAAERDVAALEQAAAPVSAALEATPQTKAFIERIRTMKVEVPGTSGPAVKACETSGDAPTPTVDAETAAFPEGSYRVEYTAEFLVEQGMEPIRADQEAGIATLTFSDGRWLHRVHDGREECGGIYSVDAGRISLVHDVAQCGAPAGALILSATWTRGDGELRFSNIRSGLGEDPFAEAYWGGKPWTKIG
jgi:TRAP-type C4-dicarboxylate transport system substrate-binding protein